MRHNFDPYDALIEMNARITALETAHNRLADAYVKSQKDLSVTMDSLVSLQKSHLIHVQLLRHHGITSK